MAWACGTTRTAPPLAVTAVPPTSVATIAAPARRASWMVRGWPSHRLVWTTMSATSIRAGASFRRPRSATGSCSAAMRSAACSRPGPSPARAQVKAASRPASTSRERIAATSSSSGRPFWGARRATVRRRAPLRGQASSAAAASEAPGSAGCCVGTAGMMASSTCGAPSSRARSARSGLTARTRSARRAMSRSSLSPTRVVRRPPTVRLWRVTTSRVRPRRRRPRARAARAPARRPWA